MFNTVHYFFMDKISRNLIVRKLLLGISIPTKLIFFLFFSALFLTFRKFVQLTFKVHFTESHLLAVEEHDECKTFLSSVPNFSPRLRMTSITCQLDSYSLDVKSSRVFNVEAHIFPSYNIYFILYLPTDV